MPNIKSAKKRVLVNAKKTEQNKDNFRKVLLIMWKREIV